MTTINVAVNIFRRSSNTNAFGLRGYWAIEEQPLPGSEECRVWSFATSEDMPKGDRMLPFFVNEAGQHAMPAFELPELKGTVLRAKRSVFLAPFHAPVDLAKPRTSKDMHGNWRTTEEHKINEKLVLIVSTHKVLGGPIATSATVHEHDDKFLVHAVGTHFSKRIGLHKFRATEKAIEQHHVAMVKEAGGIDALIAEAKAHQGVA